jgi:acyl-CoA synthetase (AMP-forming)/AMP-acid ligase II
MFRDHPTPSLSGLVSGAAEFPQALREQAIQRFGARAIHDFYGATELGWITFLNGEEMLRKPGSVGRAMAGQDVAIMDKDGRKLPPGEVGLIYVRNSQTMGGYLHDKAATEQSVKDGWMTVEDLGRIDADGYLFLAGRERDMVKSGGVNVYPVEIEEVLNRHPSVKECAVIGIPDPEWGEKLVGVVVARDRAAWAPSDVEAFARKELAGFKVPKRWELVDELPRNNTGKVLKTDLRKRFTAAG